MNESHPNKDANHLQPYSKLNLWEQWKHKRYIKSLTPKVQPRAELPDCNPATNWNSKYTDFVAMMILIILHDLHFGQNQPLEMADD